MPLCSWDTAPEPVRSQVRRFLRDMRTILGDNLIGLYLHGSLVMGCFHPEQSDVDLLAVTRQGLAPETKRLMAGLLLTLSGAPNALELHILLEADLRRWRHPFPYDFHYSEDWRERFEANLSRLDWEVWHAAERLDPDLAAHFTILRERGGIALLGPPARELFPAVPVADYLDAILYDYESARDEIVQKPVYGVLNLLRVLWFVTEGQISSKEEAGRWGADTLPDGELREVAALALARYRGEEPPEVFTPEGLKRFVQHVDGRLAELLPPAPAPGAPKPEQPVLCLRCELPMAFAGTRPFHQGWAPPPGGGWTGLEVQHLYFCPGCGKLEAFLRPIPGAPTAEPPALTAEPAAPEAEPGLLADPSPGDATLCLACGHPIGPNQERCAKCGWTWQ